MIFNVQGTLTGQTYYGAPYRERRQSWLHPEVYADIKRAQYAKQYGAAGERATPSRNKREGRYYGKAYIIGKDALRMVHRRTPAGALSLKAWRKLLKA